MSFDDKQAGVPNVNVHKRTTKVNLWMIAAVVIFMVAGMVAAIIFLRQL